MLRTILSSVLRPFPRAKTFAKAVVSHIQGLPPVTAGDLTPGEMRRLVGKDNPVILEIGCNDGTHTLRFFEAFPNPTVFCFEPEPRAIARFKANIAAASNNMLLLQSNLRLFEMAISDRNGEIAFYQSDGTPNEQFAEFSHQAPPEGWDQSGSIRQPDEHLETFPWVKFDNVITVPTMMLDAWCQEQGIETIDFIWMDVQGAEIDVFRGATRTLAKTRFLFTEYSERRLYSGQYTLKQLLEYLKDFDVLTRYPGDILLKNKVITK